MTWCIFVVATGTIINLVLIGVCCCLCACTADLKEHVKVTKRNVICQTDIKTNLHKVVIHPNDELNIISVL